MYLGENDYNCLRDDSQPASGNIKGSIFRPLSYAHADSREVETAVLEKFPPQPMPIEFTKGFDGIDAEEEQFKKHPVKTQKTA